MKLLSSVFFVILCTLLTTLKPTGGQDQIRPTHYLDHHSHNAKRATDSTHDEGYPIQLVMPDKTHSHFILNQEGLKYLAKIPSPLCVISAVGSIHTGKSFLLNRILGSNSGFDLGHTVNPGTTGLWMWSKPIELKNESVKNELGVDTLSVLVIDSEGFFGPDVPKNYDETLYAITSLISTHLLFVSVKMMDGRELENLEELTRGANLFGLRAYSKSLTNSFQTTQDIESQGTFSPTNSFNKDIKDIDQEKISIRHVDSAEIIESLSPTSLTWVVQDFIQDLEGMTPLDWLNKLIDTTHRSTTRNTIETDEGIQDTLNSDDLSDSKKPIRHSLREMYDSIDCMTLNAPAPHDSLRYLDTLSYDDLSEAFKSEMNELRSRLFQKAVFNIKRSSRASTSNQNDINLMNTYLNANEKASWMSGADLADLLRFLVKAANEKYFVHINTFMDKFLEFRANVIKNNLMEFYDSAMSSFLNSYPPPLPDDLSEYISSLNNRTLSLWDRQFLGDPDIKWAQLAKGSLIESLGSGENYKNSAELNIKSYCRKYIVQQLHKDELSLNAKRNSLPIPKFKLEDWLQKELNKGKEILSKSINQHGRSYTNLIAYRNELKDYSSLLEEKHLQIRSLNNVAISKRFELANKAALKSYFDQLEDKNNFLVFQSSIKNFEDKLFEWNLIAYNEFSKVLGDLEQMRTETDDAKKKLEGDLRAPADKARKLWDDQCIQQCEEISKQCKRYFKDKILSEIFFPVEEELLQYSINKHLILAKKQMSNIFCSPSKIWDQKMQKLVKDLELIGTKLEQENIEAIKTHLKQPLDDVKKSLEAKAEKCTSWNSFIEIASSDARSAISNNMHLNELPELNSQALVEKVINNWLNSDLEQAFRETIEKNRQEVYWKKFGCAIIFIGLLMLLVSNNKPISFCVLFGGLYVLLGAELILTLNRKTFKENVTYYFITLENLLGFEIMCLFIPTASFILLMFTFFFFRIILTKFLAYTSKTLV